MSRIKIDFSCHLNYYRNVSDDLIFQIVIARLDRKDMSESKLVIVMIRTLNIIICMVF
jgi:hypothetical protein